MYDYWSQWRTHGTITEYLIKPWIRQREFCFNEMLVLICERSAALEIICKACAHTHAHLPSRGLLVLRDNHSDGSCQRDNYIATEAQRSVLHWMWERKKCYYSATSLFISATNQKKAFLKKKKEKKNHFWVFRSTLLNNGSPIPHNSRRSVSRATSIDSLWAGARFSNAPIHKSGENS